MFIIRGFKEQGGFFCANQRRSCQDAGRPPGSRELGGELCLDRIDNDAAADRGSRRDRCAQSLNLDHGVAHRRPGIQDQV